MDSPVVYQGIERWEMLRLVRRLCLSDKEYFLSQLCSEKSDTCKVVEAWSNAIQHRLEDKIRATRNHGGREAMSMPLFADSVGLARALTLSLQSLCRAWMLDQESKADSILWQTLSQFFKRKMDELDGYGAGHGTHVLQARRRIEKIARDLVERKAESRNGPNSYPRLADLAADVAMEVRRRGLGKQLPATPTKILEYLYESEAACAVSEDPWDDRIILGEIASPEVLIQLGQCLEMLPEELSEALSFKFGNRDEPVFLNEQGYKEHYGVGREAMRKRVSKARKMLLDCLFGEEPQGSVNVR